MDFRDYYKLPLKIDQYCPCYVWTADDEMAFQFMVDDEDLCHTENLYNIVSAINLSCPVELDGEPEVNAHDPAVIDIGGKPTIIIRGWGNLIGTGGHNLHPAKAVAIQDSFRDYIIQQLNKIYYVK